MRKFKFFFQLQSTTLKLEQVATLARSYSRPFQLTKCLAVRRLSFCYFFVFVLLLDGSAVKFKYSEIFFKIRKGNNR